MKNIEKISKEISSLMIGLSKEEENQVLDLLIDSNGNKMLSIIEENGTDKWLEIKSKADIHDAFEKITGESVISYLSKLSYQLDLST